MFILFMSTNKLGQLIIEAEDRGCQHQELGAHHQNTCRNVMICADDERSESEADSREKRADGHSRFYFLIVYHIEIQINHEDFTLERFCQCAL